MLIFASCEKEEHRASFRIINKLDCDVIVELYAKKDYSLGNLYRPSKNGGGYIENVQKFEPYENGYEDRERAIFDTDEWDKLPSDVLTVVFDSIKIIVCKGDSLKLLFSDQKLKNYKYNLFLDNSAWNHETKVLTFPTMFKENKTEYEQYYFDIDSTKIQTPNDKPDNW